MRESTHRRTVMTEWAAAAVGVMGIAGALTEGESAGLLGMLPVLSAVLAWALHRAGRGSEAAMVLVVGCVAGAVVGGYTPEVEQSGIAEVMWLTVGTILAAFLLPLRHYAVTAGLVVVAEAVALMQNPMVSVRLTVYVVGFLAVVGVLGVVGLRFVEHQDARARARARTLQKALDDARDRAEALAAAQLSLQETRSQLVHLGRLASLGELSAEISHELNNPLTTVLMASEVLRDELEGVDGELATVAGEVLEAAQACHAVTERVLWYGRRERRAHRDLEPVSLAEVVRRAASLTRAPRRKVRCRLEIDLAQDAVVLGDPVQLTQVVVNLLVNAMSVMPEGDGVVRVAGGVDGGCAWLTVSDGGPGVPQAIADRIFEPFFSTRTADGGTGLGLAISRTVVEAHGGTLELETFRPEPACFRIELPDSVPAEAPQDLFALR